MEGGGQHLIVVFGLFSSRGLGLQVLGQDRKSVMLESSRPRNLKVFVKDILNTFLSLEET